MKCESFGGTLRCSISWSDPLSVLRLKKRFAGCSKHDVMRVTLCVDALEPRLGGIGRYTWELCKGLSRRNNVRPLFFARNQLIENPAVLLTDKGMRRPRTRLVRSYRLRAAQRALGSSVMHGPNYFLPAFAETGVITIHDLSVFRYPHLHPAERVEQFERNLRRSIV